MSRRLRSFILSIPLAGALVGAILAAPVQAGPPPSPAGAVGSSAVSVPAGAAASYWTKERMLAAKPVPVPRVDAATNAKLSEQAKPQGRAGKIDGAAALGQERHSVVPLVDPGATAATWAGSMSSPPGATSGKVFFVGADGLNYVCSGSTVNSGGKNLVFTAGHCVSNGSGIWYNSAPWTFVPGYNNGNAPHGQWTARQLWTRPAWHNGANRAEDIGAAVMFTNAGGTRIVDYVGGQGIEWNYPLSQYQFQFGYPTRTPFNGQILKYCTGQSYSDGGHNGINCNMTEGASGGPWLDDFNGTFGWLDSVNSWVFWNSSGVRYKWNGPYFGNNARDFYNAIANL
ncbi:peptidase [Actinoplanes sp. NEAU-A12]|uniref:Peptidase n=1 Tax=Actinoplanes sandaracinus TaxID=3045177 RepID=A0ABT6WCN7_9ACTN|nr:peptidase [Actinoplanes sandaracinus]MDI6097471.1 peptidase [Actinoplanes sandaracinus]